MSVSRVSYTSHTHTRTLVSIPRYAVELSEHVDRLLANPAEDIVALQTSLSRLIHAKGINIRHLGALFTEATTHACRMMLLIEMVRVCRVRCLRS